MTAEKLGQIDPEPAHEVALGEGGHFRQIRYCRLNIAHHSMVFIMPSSLQSRQVYGQAHALKQPDLVEDKRLGEPGIAFQDVANLPFRYGRHRGWSWHGQRLLYRRGGAPA